MLKISLTEFKTKWLARLKESMNVNGQRNFVELESQLKNKTSGYVIMSKLNVDTGGHLLQLASLCKTYKQVDPLLIGKAMSIYFCN